MITTTTTELDRYDPDTPVCVLPECGRDHREDQGADAVLAGYHWVIARARARRARGGM